MSETNCNYSTETYSVAENSGKERRADSAKKQTDSENMKADLTKEQTDPVKQPGKHK